MGCLAWAASSETALQVSGRRLSGIMRCLQPAERTCGYVLDDDRGD